MKLFNIIKPHHGAICICNSFLGDARDEEALDRYDIDGSTKMDANYHLYADLELDEPWFEKGIVRLEFYGDDNTVKKIVLDLVMKDGYSTDHMGLNVLYDYLDDTGLFDFHPTFDGFVYRNGINDLFIEDFERELIMELYPPSDSGSECGPNFEKGAIQTVSALLHNVGDDWKEYLRTRLNA